MDNSLLAKGNYKKQVLLGAPIFFTAPIITRMKNEMKNVYFANTWFPIVIVWVLVAFQLLVAVAGL